MTIYKVKFKSLALVAMLLLPSTMLGVTKDEMEEARTIATKSYLRYANDGSGYLDDLNPKTMEELEASLKAKEKENIKAFKAIPVPTDYKDWGMDQLVEYWAVTAYQNKGLLEKGRGGRIRTRSLIKKMKLSAPTPQAQATTVAPAETTVSSQESTSQNAGGVTPKEAQAELNQLNEQQKEIDAIEEENDASLTPAYNYTWVYIMVLVLLVGIVVALVVYAANVLKKNGNEKIVVGKGGEIDSEKLNQLKKALEEKESEISMLNRKLENSERRNQELRTKYENLSIEMAAMKKGAPQAGVSINRERESTERSQREQPAASKGALRSIYLGRANSKGIFVRADRTLNVGHSVYILETGDGYNGTFKVANSPAAWSLALSNPKEYLDNACTGMDPEEAATSSRVVTETAGTAIFEGGCWRVIRKARIRYE